MLAQTSNEASFHATGTLIFQTAPDICELNTDRVGVKYTTSGFTNPLGTSTLVICPGSTGFRLDDPAVRDALLVIKLTFFEHSLDRLLGWRNNLDAKQRPMSGHYNAQPEGRLGHGK
jgi:hypothetical protein